MIYIYIYIHILYGHFPQQQTCGSSSKAETNKKKCIMLAVYTIMTIFRFTSVY
jgi:hypothetical protein